MEEETEKGSVMGVVSKKDAYIASSDTLHPPQEAWEWREEGNEKAKEKKRKEGATERGTYRRRRSDHVNPKDLQGGEWVDGEIIGITKCEADEENDDFGDVP